MKKRTLLLISPLLFSLLACSPKNDGDEERRLLGDMLTLDFSILLSDGPSETAEYVASELQTTFRNCTNVTLDIVNDSSFDGHGHFISLGNTSYFERAKEGKIDLSKEAMNEDGFYIYTNNANVYINSYNDRGLMYGVYEFLEDTLGVRYLTHEYTYYPTGLERVDLYSYDKAYVPLFPQRAYLNTPVFQNDFEYVAHMRFNTDYAVMPSYMGGSSLWHQFPVPGHTVGAILPYTDYLAGGTDINGNPLIKEEYREVYQHRIIDEEIVSNWYLGALDLCYSNGVDYNVGSDKSTLNLMIESLKRILSEDKECEYLHIGQADVAYSCPCSHCAEAAGKYRASGVMIRFVNKVEEAVNSWLREEQNGREITFSMFAYSYNVQPPLDENGEILDPSVVPHQRVAIKYAPIQADYIYSLDDSRQNDNTRGQLKRWSTLGCDFMAWTYATIFSNYFVYYPHYQSLKNLLTELKDAKVIYEFDQSLYDEYGVYQQYLDAYVFSKLCWNIDADVNEIVQDFCRYYFGEDAYLDVYNYHLSMDSYYNYLASRGIRLTAQNGDFVTSENFPYRLTKQAYDYFEDAMEKTANNSSLSEANKSFYLANLEKASLMPLYLKLRLYPYYDGVSDDMTAELAAKFFGLTDKYGIKKYGENAALTMANLKKEYGI